MTIFRSASIDNANIKTRWEEPYVSSAINQELGALPRGVYRGFVVTEMDIPGKGVKIGFGTDSESFLIHWADGFVNSLTFTEEFNFLFDFSNPPTTEICIWVDIVYAESSETVGYIRAGSFADRLSTSITLAKISLAGGDEIINDADITQNASVPDTFLTPVADTSEGNRFGFMTEDMVDVLPTSDQKDAMDGSDSPDASNPFAVVDNSSGKYFASPVTESFSGAAVTEIQLTGWFYVGNGGIGTAGKYFRLHNSGEEKELLGSDFRPIKISYIYKSDDSAKIVPSSDATDGFYENPILKFDFRDTADTDVSDFDVFCGERVLFKDVNPYGFMRESLGFKPNVNADVWANVVRRYTTLKDGISGTSYPENFVVEPPITGLRENIDLMIREQNIGGANDIDHLCTDGLCVYYADGINIYCVDADTGTEKWSITLASAASEMCTDGRYLYIAFDSSTDAVKIYGTHDGSELKTCTITTGATCNGLASNGVRLIGAFGDIVYSWEVDDASPISPDWNTDHGANVQDVCIDDKYSYVAGNTAPDDADIRILHNVTGSEFSNIDLDQILDTHPSVGWVKTDGERLYICMSRTQLQSSTEYASILAMSKPYNESSVMACDLIWSFDTGQNGWNIVVDDRSVCVNYNGYIWELNKVDGHVKDFIDYGKDVILDDVDGISFFLREDSGTDYDYWVRISFTKNAVLYQRVRDTDISRRPFYKLAVPCRER